MFNTSIKIKDYKCFSDEIGFEKIKRVNIIIGKNNSGKSSLLDIFDYVCREQHIDIDSSKKRNNVESKIIIKSILNKDDSINIKDLIPSFTKGRDIFSDSINNSEILFSLDISKDLNYTLISYPEFEKYIGVDIMAIRASEGIINYVLTKLKSNKKFIRLSAERDITAEMDSEHINIKPNASGITNAIQQYLNNSKYKIELVHIDMLNALNEIFLGDAYFKSIKCRINSNLWEIYFEEEEKGFISLSNSGSGLKTVISVLTNLILVPDIEKKELSNFIFAFEELENNIHPALLRKLVDYIYQLSLKENFIFFLTTHSNILIDQFGKQDDAQILHVTHKDGVSDCKVVTTYIENNGILDDLDVRASDLLQANGIIWVEGPSDRIYLNKWIEIWSNGKLREGTHYQIIFYGGRLLSHLSGCDPEEIKNIISMLNVNRNAIVLIDSDKKSEEDSINDTKQRIKNEFESHESLCWITKGREIENYLGKEIINRFLNVTSTNNIPQYESFFDYINEIKDGEGTKYSSKKMQLAENLITLMDYENVKDVLDMDEQLNKVCTEIRKWNNIKD